MANAKYLYLMIKTHQVTGLKYLCKKVTTSDSKAISYKGSGTRWNNHLKVHGNHINTEILAKYDLDKINEFSQLCIEYSNKFDIVKSNEWANLIEETGKPGTKIGVYCGKNGTFYGKKHTFETRQKISAANKGDNNVMRRRPDSLAKMIATKNTIEYKEAARLRAIETNSRPEVKEKIIQSKLGKNNPAADKNIYILKHKETNNLIEGTRFELAEKTKTLASLNTNIKILSNGDIGEFNRKNRNIKTVKGWIKI
jgi:hypothetical protein